MAEEYIEIPVNFQLPSQVMRIALSRERFQLRFDWNTREESWYMSIYKDSKTPILYNAKILPGWIPFRKFTVEGQPQGVFAVVDSSGTNTPPGRFDFGLGRRVRLIYNDPTVS